MQNLSYENEFHLQFNGLVSKTDFQMKGFGLGLVLKQRQRELGNGLLNEFCCVVAIVCKGEKRYFDSFTCAES